MNTDCSEEKTDILPKSPSVLRRQLEHKIDMEEKEQENTWKSCCYDLNKNAVMYFTTIIIITGIMAFCIYKLSINLTCESQTVYMGLLTLLLGILAPSPVFKKK